MRVLIYLIITVALIGSGSCQEKDKLNVAAHIKADTMPTMKTRNIATLISDSGIVQYKIVAPLWKVYDNTTDPYWLFPEGVYLQKFDRRKKVIATVAADSARYFKNRKLWKLDGHVEIFKQPKDKFFSSQVFWDQNRHEVYSDSFIHIENSTHVLEGIGFHADENFRDYSIHKPMGIFPIENDALMPEVPPNASAPQELGIMN
ncbi:MAG: LPS export ABC transporter periplasmic protein LptC [Clostridium sp.]|nr:LPS export ABC transporter periplasmic protein LptC [Prevotella sp.]MCM1428424.1 LPS export ABC transporter periplasmic protein LptC [Clostridium sp.]MCM1474889.1 LPS export ABC transporter periplasmic protein LptC [Muribaculaceae bacterium]